MEGTAVLGRLNWRAAKVVELTPETSQTKTITFDVPGWPGHRAGQHVDVRLTADDGYQAERSYSIASAADGPRIDLTVERLDDGEVSPYLTDELRKGDVIELRGPVGGYFVWNPHAEGTVFLVAGGSGIVPLMAMARQRALEGSRIPTRLLYSARSLDDVIELAVAFVCGPTPFVEAVASGLVELGHEPARIKTERFGPTGG